MITATVTPLISAVRGEQALKAKIAKAERALVDDVKKRLPPAIKKAVRKRYRSQDAKDKALVPKWRQTKKAGGYAAFGMSLEGMKMTFAGPLQAVRVAGLPRPFSPAGPYGSRKKRRADPQGGAYAQLWVHGETPYRVITPLGKATFGEDKSRLFVKPSPKAGIPLLFQRGKRITSSGKPEQIAIKTLSVPQEIIATERIWRPRMDEVIQKRLRHHLARLGIAIREGGG